MNSTKLVISAYIGLFVLAIIVIMAISLPKPDKKHGSSQEIVINERVDRNLYLAIKSEADFPKYEQCLSDKRLVDSQLFAIAIAITAVENYARPPIKRALEIFTARLLLNLSGSLPNYSLGLGQVKVLTASRILGISPNNKELLNILVDDCQNLNLVFEYLTEIDSNLKVCKERVIASTVPSSGTPEYELWIEKLERMSKRVSKSIGVLLSELSPIFRRLDTFEQISKVMNIDLRSGKCVIKIIKEYNGQSESTKNDAIYWHRLYKYKTLNLYREWEPINSIDLLFYKSMMK